MNETEDFGVLLKRLATGQTLSAEETAGVIGAMLAGEMSAVQMAAFLTALAMRAPTPEEIAGGAHARSQGAIRVAAPAGAMDLCGTGGDGLGTLNISTAASFVVAGCGVAVAKNGNRAMSSRTGSADVLEALGVNIALEAAGAEACLHAANICFMFAQAYHPAMKHVTPVRQELGFRTIFNLIGPLTNPAQVKRQLVGVYDSVLVEPIAKALKTLGATKAWVVHGSDGLDELTLSGATKVAALDNGTVTVFEVAPEDAGLTRAPVSAVKGGNAHENAQAIRQLLRGAQGPYRDYVLMNAAAALVVAGKAKDLRAGAILAADSINEGAAQAALETLVAASHEVTV